MPTEFKHPTGDRLLLEGGTLITMDKALEPVLRADILVEGQKISLIGSGLRTKLEPNSYEVIDVSGTYVMPGFIDTHRHCWQNQLRRIIPNGDVALYKEFTHVELGSVYEPNDMRLGNLVSALGALDSGVTSLVDWSHNPRTLDHALASIEGLSQAGIRSVHAFSPPTINAEPRSVYRRMFEDIQSSGSFNPVDSLISLAIGSFVRNIHEDSSNPVATSHAGDLDAAGDLHFARQQGVRTTFDGVVGPTGSHGIRLLEMAGMLGPDITYIHCNGLDEAAWCSIADSGGSVSVAATSEMQLGIGNSTPAVQEALDHGIVPSLSVDVEVALSSDFFSQMRAVLSVQRGEYYRMLYSGEEPAPSHPLTVEEVLEFATTAGAKTIGMEGLVGSLTPGSFADIICVRSDDINTMPGNSPAGTVVLAADPRNIDLVLVGGRVKKWNRQLVDVDMSRLLNDITESRNRILMAGGYEVERRWGETRPT